MLMIYQYVNNAIVFKKTSLYCVGHLHIMVNQFFRNGLAVSTRNTSNGAQQRFMVFCNAVKSHPVPATEATLILFAPHLPSISYATIKVYLSDAKHLHVSAGLHDHWVSRNGNGKL